MNPPFCAPIYDLFPSGAEIPAHISPMRLIEPSLNNKFVLIAID